MIQIYEKRGQWCARDENGRLRKFATEAAAKEAFGFTSRKEILESLHSVTSGYADVLKDLEDESASI